MSVAKHMKFTELAQKEARTESLQFVKQYANPHCWLLTADSLDEQADALWNRRNEGSLILTDGQNNVVGRWTLTNRATFLLAGFALENILKSLLVIENPSWVSNAKISSQLKSHNLVGLLAKSTLAPKSRSSNSILSTLAEGIESWARYPCALSFDASRIEPEFKEKLWRNYRAVFGTYRRKVREKLSSGWKGPHEFYGRWSFDDAPPTPSPNPKY